MILSIFCLLAVLLGAHGQFQVPDEVDNVIDQAALLADLQAQLQQLKAEETGGTTYVRWGKASCSEGAETVYSGLAGGTHWSQSGGGANYQCLPKEPQWGRYEDGVSTYAGNMYGAEYYTYFTTSTFAENLLYRDVPCAVCYVRSRTGHLMIPARQACPDGWIPEYHGYLMAERWGHPSAKDFVCVDEQAEAVGDGSGNEEGALFYPVEARCGPLPCPNYVEGRELTCVVCTK